MIALSSEALADFVGEIEAPDPTRLRQARLRLDRLTKPRGSLGRMEDIAAQYISIRNGDQRFALNKAAYVFAADHGIAAEGVSAYGQEVTRQMVLNFLDGGAAINVLARLHHAGRPRGRDLRAVAGGRVGAARRRGGRAAPARTDRAPRGRAGHPP